MKSPSEHLCPRPPSQCCSAVPISPLPTQWRIIVGATKCIPKSELPEEVEVTTLASTRLWTHPSDLTIALSASTPLYPPGRIIHVVHNHPAEQCWYVLLRPWSAGGRQEPGQGLHHPGASQPSLSPPSGLGRRLGDNGPGHQLGWGWG